MTEGYTPMMSVERARLLRVWHDRALDMQRAQLPTRMAFMGLDLHVAEDVFAPHTDDADGDPYHRAVEAEVTAGERVLDMGTGSGVNALLAARSGADVVAVDVNAKAVACARDNAARNGVADRITFIIGDIFDRVEGAFDLIVFDPPFRWFKPRDLLETGTADEGYRALTTFMSQVRHRLRPGGRVLLNFGTSGDVRYLHQLIDAAGLRMKVIPYGSATRDGMTARYFTIRLTQP